MDTLKNIIYAGFGIANEAKAKAEEKYNEFVKAGRKYMSLTSIQSVIFLKQLKKLQISMLLNQMN